MIRIDEKLTPADLIESIKCLWDLSARKTSALMQEWCLQQGSPVYTVNGKYTSRGWTEWTQGFMYGSPLLHFDATGEPHSLAVGRDGTLRTMASHLTHMGVHDHGFNIVSTYGNLWRLTREGRLDSGGGERQLYETALKCSAAVQARRWTKLTGGFGYIYSFNGPHSLFADTIRSLRSLALGHSLGHTLFEESDRKVSLLDRLTTHAATTAAHSVYYGKGRDTYDVRGRVAHESIFNVIDGNYRCPNSQQGYSPFTTWTRGLAWIMLGFAEQIEYLATLPEEELKPCGGKEPILAFMTKTARAACDHYLQSTPTDGIPYWDTGAPGLSRMDGCTERPADPFNDYEPVDSSAAAIAAQGLLRLGHHLESAQDEEVRGAARRYWQAGLTVLKTLLAEPYLSTDTSHQGLILHSVYHRPNGWDHIPEGAKIPRGESSMWGDYHALEAALYVQRIHDGAPYLRFFGPEAAE